VLNDIERSITANGMFRWKNLKERGHFRNLGVYGDNIKIDLK
jgi:hypothetical protein